MIFDFKKEFKEFYAPKDKPSLVNVPSMNYLAVRGKGNPNDAQGAYKNALEMLYGVAYTLKMSYKSNYQIQGFFPYVVPPLEGFWWQEGVRGVDYSKMDDFCWISLIRLPDFITKANFDWAVDTATKKKKRDYSQVEFFPYEEGLCVQCLHVGPFAEEPVTVELMHQFVEQQGYEINLSESRHHHEIYLSDPRKTAPEKLRTVIRHPVK